MKRSKSRGRDLRHTETQAGIDVSRYVSGERGRTDGREKVGAVSAVTPRLRRKAASLHRSPNLTASDLAKLPPDAKIALNGNGAAKIAVYYREPVE